MVLAQAWVVGTVRSRHTFSPYIEGSPLTYTQEALDEMNRPKYDYDGKKLTEYEAEQEQRALEREIRKQKRTIVSLKAANLDASAAVGKLQLAEEKQKSFILQTGLKRQYIREQIPPISGKNSIIPIAKPEKNGTINTGFQFFANRGLSKQSEKELSKSISSWRTNIEQHRKKLQSPELFDFDWASKTEAQQRGLLRHWEKEISNFESNISQAELELERRKKNV